MKFLDMAIDESLRMYPIAPRTERESSSDYVFDNRIHLKKGDICAVSIWALHHDPDIYPDPFKFDPYRFDEKSKKSREGCAFMPFGSGPRNCVGIE